MWHLICPQLNHASRNWKWNLIGRVLLCTAALTLAGACARRDSTPGILASSPSASAVVTEGSARSRSHKIVPPRIAKLSALEYPLTISGLEGSVTADITVDNTGRFVSVKTKKSSGDARAVNALIEVMRRSTYKAGTIDGVPAIMSFEQVLSYKEGDLSAP